jgi:hypothetical protein
LTKELCDSSIHYTWTQYNLARKKKIDQDLSCRYSRVQ